MSTPATTSVISPKSGSERWRAALSTSSASLTWKISPAGNTCSTSKRAWSSKSDRCAIVRKVGNASTVNLNAHRFHALVGGLVFLATLWYEHVKMVALARGMSWLAANSARFCLLVGVAFDVRALKRVTDLLRQ
eukprot:4909151-Pleurochrysis_carterae.AAC.1